jgi:isopentenyl-diphosphate Delta-isomerase
MPDELVDIVDENNNPTGEKAMKSKAHREGLWHRAAHVWIYDSDGNVLLQLRSKRKALYPGLWDVSVAGHIGAGDDPAETALREIGEEIGLSSIKQEDLFFYKVKKASIVFDGMTNNEFYYIYFLKYDGPKEALKRQEEEVDDLRFVPVAQALEEYSSHPERFVSHRNYWNEIMEQLSKIKDASA